MRLLCVLLFLFGSMASAWAEVSTYRFRSGDTLEILVWQEEGMQRKVIVAPDGMISFPLAGHIRAGGRTAREVERVVTSKLKKFITDPVVTVSYQGRPNAESAVREASIYVMGQVKKPGLHMITPSTTVMQALSLAGGLEQFAAKRRIKIIRKLEEREVSIEFDYADVMSGRDMSTNIRLRNEDVVIVPERGLFGGLFE